MAQKAPPSSLYITGVCKHGKEVPNRALCAGTQCFVIAGRFVTTHTVFGAREHGVKVVEGVLARAGLDQLHALAPRN